MELVNTPVEIKGGLPDTPPPPGAKGAFDVGNVLLLAGQAVAFEIVADTLIDWLRRRRRPAKLHIEGPNGELLELPETSLAEIKGLLLAWAQGGDDLPGGAPTTP